MYGCFGSRILENEIYIGKENVMEQSLKKSREKLRCLNCFIRIEIPHGTKIFKCPECNVEYVIVWADGQAKIGGEAKTSK